MNPKQPAGPPRTLGNMQALGIGIANQPEVAMKSYFALADLLALPLLVGPAAAHAKLERVYVIECGEHALRPMSRHGRLGSMSASRSISLIAAI